MRAARVPPQRFGWTSKANLRSVCAALDAVAPMPKRAGDETGEWRPVEVKQVLCLTGGLSDTPIPLLETREVPTNNGPKLFVHFALYLPWVFQAVLGVQCRAHLTGRAATRTGLGGKVWKQLVDDFRVAARKQTGEASRGGAAVAALDDEDGDDDDEDPMDGLLAPAQPDEPKAPKPRSNKKVKVMGRLVRVPAKEKCPLAYPQDATERQVKMISLRKNEYWVAASDLGWLFERLRSENELAGVPLVEGGDADRAAVAAPVHQEDSQESVPSTGSVDSPEARSAQDAPQARSAQGTVDLGYKCKWNFPSKETPGRWDATVTREGELCGNVVTCSLADFTKQKWNAVYSDNKKEPRKWARANFAQKKEACKLFLEQHMASILST